MSLSESLSILENPDVSIALGKLIIAIASATSETEVYATVAAYIPDILPVDRTSIILLTEDGQELEIYALHGIEGVSPIGKTIPCDGTAAGLAVRTGQPQVNWASPDSPYLDIVRLSAEGMSLFVSVPLMIHGQAIGAVNAAFSNPTLAETQILSLLTQITTLISTNLERQILLKQTQVAMEGYRSQAEQLQVLNEIARKLSGHCSFQGYRSSPQLNEIKTF